MPTTCRYNKLAPKQRKSGALAFWGNPGVHVAADVGKAGAPDFFCFGAPATEGSFRQGLVCAGRFPMKPKTDRNTKTGRVKTSPACRQSLEAALRGHEGAMNHHPKPTFSSTKASFPSNATVVDLSTAVRLGPTVINGAKCRSQGAKDGW